MQKNQGPTGAVLISHIPEQKFYQYRMGDFPHRTIIQTATVSVPLTELLSNIDNYRIDAFAVAPDISPAATLQALSTVINDSDFILSHYGFGWMLLFAQALPIADILVQNPDLIVGGYKYYPEPRKFYEIEPALSKSVKATRRIATSPFIPINLTHTNPIELSKYLVTSNVADNVYLDF